MELSARKILKRLNYQDNRGLSIIELLITILLITSIVGAGIANYRRLNARKQVEDAAKHLEQAIRETQKNATAGIKPAGICSGTLTLKNYQIVLDGALGNKHFQINQVCSDNSVVSGTTYVLQQNVVINSSATINFDLLGRANADTTVCLRDPGNHFFYQIRVNIGGSVSFVKTTSC